MHILDDSAQIKPILGWERLVEKAPNGSILSTSFLCRISVRGFSHKEKRDLARLLDLPSEYFSQSKKFLLIKYRDVKKLTFKKLTGKVNR
jgi:hypothetical protein